MLNDRKAIRVYLQQYLDGEHLEKLEDLIADAVRIFNANAVVINDHTGNSISVNPKAFNPISNEEGGCDG